MFDVSPDEIAQLNDSDLRELIGRLCEAELVSRGLSPAAVTWGGDQRAADGGLDVRVALPPETAIEGFIPRPSTGFQAKIPDMPRAAILAEMRPAGTVRPAIQELADESGAYIIVSSHGSTSDAALGNRRDALREGLAGVANASDLHTDFYDRTRLASWVRRHPGLITWVKEKVGGGLSGWRPYGPWSGPAEGVEAEYLLDDKLRLHFGRHSCASAHSVAEAIDELRDVLAEPGKIVRLVGLSGVGKTRLVQALFDARVGARPLPPSQAVYTNLSDNPDPQPIGLASSLIANRVRAMLIVDNCPPDLHQRLSDLCAATDSTVSVLTVEYDVRDDQPEGTQVVTLDTSSPELIENLVVRRFPHLSQVDARTISEVSGGNARIAIALAETVRHSETVAGLSNDELFQRLFRQGHDANDALLLAAQACSLVYSFQGEALIGDEAELPRLASLVGQQPQELYRHVAELIRRDLVQTRSVWRAVLPHAIANRLAAEALDNIPYDLIDRYLVADGTDRLARSFSRRLSFLHKHPRARAIVEQWLAPEGLLGDVAALGDVGRAMFENVAPVLPEAILAALERSGEADMVSAAAIWRRHQLLLRSLAYEPRLFNRSAYLLAQAATQRGEEGRESEQVRDTFVSLFTIYLSGTHASIEQRLAVIEQLLCSGEPEQVSLGLAALDAILETTSFSSGYRFEFGVWSRDFGYRPRSNAELREWYSSALRLIERFALTEGVLQSELSGLVACSFRGLWTSVHMFEELEILSLGFAADGFWREGWTACRQTMRYDRSRLDPESSLRLADLEAKLRPSNLQERVRAVVLSDRSGGLDLEDMELDGDTVGEHKRLDAIARELGATVAIDASAFGELLPDLLRGGNRAWQFGCGLAAASEDHRATWAKLVHGLGQLPPGQRNVQVIRGFLAELWEQDRDIAQEFLDEAVDEAVLAEFVPVLHSAVYLDARGVERLERALQMKRAPVWKYGALAGGRTADQLAGSDLKRLLLLIADQVDGFDVALEILHMRFFSDRSEQREHAPELLEVGRELLQRFRFEKNDQRDQHKLAELVRTCLAGPVGVAIAGELAGRLKAAVAAFETYAFNNSGLLAALLSTHPHAVLDVLFDGGEGDRKARIGVFDHIDGYRSNPANEISRETLIDWCDRDPNVRYPLVAGFVTFARHAEERGPLVWSEQAKALLANAPDFKRVLEVFIERFQPMSWSGSRAALMETNARLLDDLDAEVPAEHVRFIKEAKRQLAQEIASERQHETERDYARDERFE
ncbi:hypothetical protein V6C03_13470 [Methyloligella sp. 2.7D]|uniref:hypothetical protein n=1 Tax=unclassified Methyloligella TaxID=2625955 RepID=UPI00157CCEFF|nr:hypothetical protein [Methyloligella sp. GL2]QKP77221.1 hypothetical protein HT051_06995 [Methyloligella sp. GL2]